MLLYLVRHAEAEDHEDDEKRPLSEKGLKDIGNMARHLRKLDITVDRILHSPLLRARQTAETLGKHVKSRNKIDETAGLLPGDNPDLWAKKLKKTGGAVMLVGHQPHMGSLAALLLGCNEEDEPLKFRKAAVACLERSRNTWSVQWLITPKVIGKK